MELFLFRHAEAEPRSAETPDERRTLTVKGRERFLRGAECLQRLEVELDRVYHSPWLRSIESAELLTLLLDGETVVTPLLAQPPTRELLDLFEGERVAVVGHEPWLTQLIAWLVTGAPERAPNFELKKGAMARLHGEARFGAMTLGQLLTPKVLTRLGRR